MPRTRWLVIALTAIACSSNKGDEQPLAPAGSCSPLEIAVANVCTAVGVPKDGCGSGFSYDGEGGCTPIMPASACAPGTMATPGDTTCRAVGVKTCASGFVADGRGGCSAQMANACARGTFALPGDAACHEPSACAAPTDATMFVDATAAAGGDGSAAKPYTTIAAAIAGASSSSPSVIAIAPGSYAGGVTIAKPIRLVGRCGAQVTITGSGTTPAVRLDHPSASLERVAITGTGVLIDRGTGLVATWVHDTVGIGIRMKQGALRDVLVEKAAATGVEITGADATLDGLAVRDVAPTSTGTRGWGVGVEWDGTVRASKVSAKRLMIERVREAGIHVGGSTLTLDASVIRDVTARPDRTEGWGLSVERTNAVAPSLTVRGSLIERSTEGGIALSGGALLVQSTTVREIRPRMPSGTFGWGIVVVGKDAPASATIEDVLIERATEVGIMLRDAGGSLRGTLVRDTQPGSKGIGRGLDLNATKPTKIEIRDVSVVSSLEHGLIATGPELDVDGLSIVSTKARADGVYGVGFGVHGGKVKVRRLVVSDAAYAGVVLWDLTAEMRETLVERVTTAHSATDGEMIGPCFATFLTQLDLRTTVLRSCTSSGLNLQLGTSTVDAITVTDVVASAGEGFGHGVSLLRDATDRTASLTLTHSKIARTRLAGLNVDRGKLDLRSVLILDVAANEKLYGDGLTLIGGETTVRELIVRGAARAGISVFGGRIEVASTRLRCNAFDLDVEPSAGVAPTLIDGGDVQCGCNDALVGCRAQSAGLQPVPLPGAPKN